MKTIFIDKNYLSFRHQVKEILKKILKTKSKIVYLDFSKVKFISRSFADEFLNMIQEFKNKGISVRLKNINEDSRKMLEIVKYQKEKIRKEFFKKI